mgnify:CR=1 FL=1
MPVKNAGLYLDECLNSIINQTYKEWELIAINDHSEDNSFDILRKFAARHKNISELDILNTNGQLIRTKTINAQSTQINISNLSKGIYFMKIHFDFGVITKKIILD